MKNAVPPTPFSPKTVVVEMLAKELMTKFIVTEEALRRLTQRRRLSPGTPKHFEWTVRVSTLGEILQNNFGVRGEDIFTLKNSMEKESFEKSVESLMDKIAPVKILIVPR